MANLSLLRLWLHWIASFEHRQYCRLIIWKYLVAALVPVSEEVCRSVDVYQRGKLLTLELKTGTWLWPPVWWPWWPGLWLPWLGWPWWPWKECLSQFWQLFNFINNSLLTAIWIYSYLSKTRMYWAVLGCTGLHMTGCARLYWALLSCTRLYWAVLGCTELFLAVLRCAEL